VGKRKDSKKRGCPPQGRDQCHGEGKKKDFTMREKKTRGNAKGAGKRTPQGRKNVSAQKGVKKDQKNRGEEGFSCQWTNE